MINSYSKEAQLKGKSKGNDYADEVWSKAVVEKYGGICQRCFQPRKLDPHHKASKKQFPELRHDVENGIGLCRECHRFVHDHPALSRKEGFIISRKGGNYADTRSGNGKNDSS